MEGALVEEFGRGPFEVSALIGRSRLFCEGGAESGLDFGSPEVCVVEGGCGGELEVGIARLEDLLEDGLGEGDLVVAGEGFGGGDADVGVGVICQTNG